MSQENVELTRERFEALLAAMNARTSTRSRNFYHGHEGVRRFFGEWLEPFEAFYAHADDFIAEGDSVVVRLRQGGRGRGSGVEVAMPVVWQVYRIRDGRVIRVLGGLMDRPEALEAAGLRE
jgi:ketosteroid isomerase-like protein